MNAEIDRLANEILDYSRNKLLVNMRFLDMALSYHKRSKYDGTIATDGKSIFYNSIFLLGLYKKSQEETIRAYLHMILHCIFHHPFVEPSIDRRLWDLACDMAVESTINDLQLPMISSEREEKQKLIVSELRKEITILSAEKIYAVFKRAEYPDWAIEQWETTFRSDEHFLWYIWEVSISVGSDAKKAVSIKDEGDFASAIFREDTFEIRGFWEKTSAQLLMDLESFSKKIGDSAGNIIQNLRSVNREKYDYSSFLRKFAVLGENMKVNEDEFDYVYYTYGLMHYKNMPLIEPLEYKDVKRIKEFVIAIDTSGSVMGDEVQRFLQKTFNILMQEDSYFSRVNIHIIQCDAEIQEKVIIHDKNEFVDYLKTMKVKGLGGTDFRPVFRYVDQMIEEHSFQNLKGMIYFTDGYGIFPERKPQYTTAFIFVKDDYEIPQIPPWAIKLVLQHEDIMEGGLEI